MANIYNEPGSTNVKITLKNNVYSYLNTNIGIAKICLITDQKKFGYSDLQGNLKKCLTDASGSSVTPENCVFIADSEGSASHSTTFVYNDNKLGVNIATPQNKAHFHEPSTGNCLIQITNTSRGSSDDNDGMTIGIVGDDNVIRTTYHVPVKIQVEESGNPGTFVDLATFQDIGWPPNTILDTDLTVNIIPAKSTAATVFLTHDNNTITTRTAAQVRDDIGAQPSNSNLTAIAGLTPTARNVIIGTGTTWTRRALVEADLPSLSAAKITSGTLDNARLSFNPDFFVQGTNNRRMISVDSTNPLVSNEFCTFFRMENTDPAFDSRLSTTGIGLGLKVINSSTLYSFELMGQSSGNGVILFGGTDPAGNRYPWKTIWHSGNFNPADYQPAITGTANKVLSIQAGGSGVKTGSINDDGNAAHFEKAFIGNSLSTGIRHYHDVFLYSNQSAAETGILKIVMPQGWANTFQRITIKGYNYITNGAWECIIGGYNYNATNDANDAWVNYSAQIRGNAPFSQVRLGYDGSKCVILLGTPETVWRYAKVAISDMLVGSAIYGWETGWSASIITSEAGLTKVVTPTTSIYGNSAVIPNTALIGKTTATGDYKLEVEGDALVTGYTASIYPSNSSVYYRDVYQYSSNMSYHTGTMKFTLPKTWANTMLVFTIKGYDYDYDRGAWECIISGYNYRGEDPELGGFPSWFNCSAEIRGFAPFSQVRFAHDGTKSCLLLGDTSTYWVYPQVAITEVFASFGETSGWGEPYSMEFITSESGLYISDSWVNISIYGDRAVIPNTALIGKTTAIGGYGLEVEGNTLVNGTLKANKLGVNIAAPQNKAHFHEPTTGSCLIQITNSTTGSSDEYDGMTVGVVGDDNVIRTTYMRPVKIQSEVPGTPGTFRDIATFKDEGVIGDVILDANLYVGGIVYLDPSKIKAGTSQAGAGAVAGELWRNTSTGALHLGI